MKGGVQGSQVIEESISLSSEYRCSCRPRVKLRQVKTVPNILISKTIDQINKSANQSDVGTFLINYHLRETGTSPLN